MQKLGLDSQPLEPLSKWSLRLWFPVGSVRVELSTFSDCPNLETIAGFLPRVVSACAFGHACLSWQPALGGEVSLQVSSNKCAKDPERSH